MAALVKASQPFHFCTRMHLTELTGLRASTLKELVSLMKTVPGSSIYHHTHRFLQQHQYLNPEPPNDFAYWVREIIGEMELSEQLASIDTVRFSCIRDLREAFVTMIARHIKRAGAGANRCAKPGDEFHFIKSVSFVFWTDHYAHDLREFADILSRITVESIYFHIFEARLRLEKETNDFSHWIDTSLGNRALAEKIARLDPYTYTFEELRKALIALIEKEID